MTKRIILSKGDFALILNFIKNNSQAFSDFNTKKLINELQNAKVVANEKLPPDVVRLNSEVNIIEAGQKENLKLKLVMPAEADIKKNRISLFAPLSAALIGYRKGDTVEWDVPMGTKRYEILDVKN